MKYKIKNASFCGFSLIEIIIGAALMLTVFLGIFGMMQMGMKLVTQSKAKITALALANQKIELARNFPYDSLGTIGGIPPGSIPETETIIRNKITYTVKTTIVYVDDPFDNTFPNDSLAWDYKRVKVKVSWSGFLGGQVFLQTDVAPKGIETTGGGDIISVLVFNANGQPIPQADIHLENSTTSPPIDAHYQTDSQGRLFISGAPACNDCYKITAAKTGYSTERTYAVGELVRGVALAAPNKPLVSVLEGQLSEISFTIDRLSAKIVQTIKYMEEKSWSDSFDDETKINEKFQAIASTTLSQVIIEEQTPGQYFSFGYILSTFVTPISLVEWGILNWNDETPIFTDIRYQILYNNGTIWILIPDADLTIGGIKNSEGFSDSPIDLSGLDPLKYKSIKIKANFSTTDANITPALSDWQITWFSSDTSTPVPNLAFVMRGTKTLGLDASGQPIYKYRENLSSNGSGQLTISNLEWDSYKITINGSATGYDLANSSPSQPVNINPGVDQTTTLKLADHQSNTLLITVKDASGQPLVGTSARLYKTGYDKTKLTTDSGQAFFSPLTLAIYNLEIKMAGYQDWSGQVDISGQIEQVIILISL
jgi:type II secretory pathway pseudopilin PulG